MLKFALPKGRLEKKTLELLAGCGIEVIKPDTRELIYYSKDKNYSFMSVRNVDVPTYVEHGVADIGVVGKDVLLEQGRELYEPIDLGFGKCHLMVATTAELADKPYPYNLKVGTKYPNIAKKYFLEKGISCEIIKLYGSVELAPIAGLATHIVDIVTTGLTLKENNLKEIEFVQASTARLIVNKASFKMHHEKILQLIAKMREILKK